MGRANFAELPFSNGWTANLLAAASITGLTPLTMNQPEDHIHHQGMWVAWKKVNGVNFWEQPKPGEDPTGFGRIIHQRNVEQSADAEKAQFTVENAWVDWQDVTHLRETRRTTVFPPGTDHLAIDVHLQFQPHGEAVTLDLNRGEPGRGGLFYSGLTIRFDNALTPGQLLDGAGRTETDGHLWATEPVVWFCWNTCGRWRYLRCHRLLIILPTRGTPTTWWVRNRENYGILHPSPAYYEPFQLTQEERLEFRYRVVLHKGYVDPDIVEQQAQEFCG